MLAYLSIGVPCGVMESMTGFSPLMAFFLSATYYSGAGQFMLTRMALAGSPAMAIATTISFMNTRQILYSAAFAPRFAQERFLPSLVFAATVTDETFGVNTDRFAQDETCPAPHGERGHLVDPDGGLHGAGRQRPVRSCPLCRRTPGWDAHAGRGWRGRGGGAPQEVAPLVRGRGHVGLCCPRAPLGVLRPFAAGERPANDILFCVPAVVARIEVVARVLPQVRCKHPRWRPVLPALRLLGPGEALRQGHAAGQPGDAPAGGSAVPAACRASGS